MEKNSWIRLVVFILIIAGVYTGYQEFVHFNLPQYWEPKSKTIAVIDSTKFHHMGNGSYSKEVHYSYLVDGKSYRNYNRNTLFKAQFLKGDSLTILYSNFRPNRSEILTLRKRK